MGDMLVCIACGNREERFYLRRVLSRMCSECMTKHARERQAAAAAVQRAIRAGSLPKPSESACADCGAPATEYDHRDYTQPLRVDAVCRPCNYRRGTAFNSFLRPQAEVS